MGVTGIWVVEATAAGKSVWIKILDGDDQDAREYTARKQAQNPALKVDCWRL